MDNSPTALKSQFMLDPEITFLNHGSYGACPKPVFKAYQQYQRDLETLPVRFMQEKVYELLERSRKALGDYIMLLNYKLFTHPKSQQLSMLSS